MTWCCDAFRSRIAREVAMEAKTPTSVAMATAASSHLVRSERLPFDASVMKTCSGSKERLSLHQYDWMLGDRRRVRRGTRYQIARLPEWNIFQRKAGQCDTRDESDLPSGSFSRRPGRERLVRRSSKSEGGSTSRDHSSGGNDWVLGPAP
jgi:hypothetical protein